MEIQNATDGNGMVLTNAEGQAMQVSFAEFWDICKAGDRMNVRNEVENYLSDCFDDYSEEMLETENFLSTVIEKVIDYRSSNENGDQIYDVLEDYRRDWEKNQEMETWKERFEALTDELPDMVIGDFSAETERLSNRIRETEEISGSTKYDLLSHISEVVFDYGKKVQEWVEQYPLDKNLFDLDDEIELSDAVLSFFEEKLYVKEMIEEHSAGGYYNELQETYLLEHLDSITADLIFKREQWYLDHPEEDITPADWELDAVDEAIVTCAKVQPFSVCTYPLCDGLPAIEMEIVGKDLQNILKAVFELSPEDEWNDLFKFLDDYTWDEGTQIKKFIENNSDFLEYPVKIQDYQALKEVLEKSSLADLISRASKSKQKASLKNEKTLLER